VTLASKIACIANQAIVDESVINVGIYQNYFRGLLKAGPVTGDLDAQVFAINGNTSITGTKPLTAAQMGSTPISSEYHFAVAAGQAISGKISKGANAPKNPKWSDIAISAPGATCNTPTATGTGDATFSCSVPAGWTGTVTAVWTGGGTHTFTATDNEFPPNVLGPTQLGVIFVLDP
jgi:hypothetical protein